MGDKMKLWKKVSIIGGLYLGGIIIWLCIILGALYLGVQFLKYLGVS